MPIEPVLTNQKQIVAKLFEVCFNQGKVELLPELVAADYSGPRGQTGPASVANTITELHATFPDIHYTVEDMIAENNRVTIRWKWEGTQVGSFRGFPATHNHVISTGIGIFQIDEDKITRSWLQIDQLGFLQQIGALPAEISPSTLQQPASK